MSTLKKGMEAEKFAASWLEDNGYEVVVRNYRYRRGEIDLIVKKDELLIFVEVKARMSSSYGFPEEAVNKKKQDLIIETADHYIHQINWEGLIRFDIISVELNNSTPQLKHFKDAFY